MQTAIAALISLRAGGMGGTLEQDLKHLRTGIDLSKSDACGLARLLIAKGIFTEQEYVDAITQSVKEEADNYEKMVQSVLSNRNIRTG